MVTTTDKWNTLPDSALAAVLRSLHDACLWVLRADAPGASESTHYCSLRTPCATAAEAFRPVQAFRSVATAWNRAFQVHCAGAAGGFLASVEDVYYPHAWHINVRVRAAPLLGRYRVVRTIDEEGRCFRLIYCTAVSRSSQVTAACLKRSTSGSQADARAAHGWF